MAIIKTIKFDLPIDGVKVKNLEELREHFTVEILDFYHSGILTKWLKSRKFDQELEAVDTLHLSNLSDSFTLMKKLCEIFRVDANDVILSIAVEDSPKKNYANTLEIENHIELIDYIDNSIYRALRLNILSNHYDSSAFDVYAKSNQTFERKGRIADKEYAYAVGVYDSDIFSGSSRNLKESDAFGWYLCSGNFKDYNKNSYLFKSIQQQRKKTLLWLAENIDIPILKDLLVTRVVEIENLIEKIPDGKEDIEPSGFVDCDATLVTLPLDIEALDIKEIISKESIIDSIHGKNVIGTVARAAKVGWWS